MQDDASAQKRALGPSDLEPFARRLPPNVENQAASYIASFIATLQRVMRWLPKSYSPVAGLPVPSTAESHPAELLSTGT